MRRAPKVEITGGPAGKDTKLVVDGVMQEAVHRVEITLDVNDAVRVTTFQFAEVVASFDEAMVEEGGWQVELRKLVVEEIPVEGAPSLFQRGVDVVGHARAGSLREAVQSLLDQMDEKANAG